MVFRKGSAKHSDIVLEIRNAQGVRFQYESEQLDLVNTDIELIAKQKIEEAKARGETLQLCDVLYDLLNRELLPIVRMPKSSVSPEKTITPVRNCIKTYLARTKLMAKQILDYMYGPPKHPKRTPKREKVVGGHRYHALL